MLAHRGSFTPKFNASGGDRITTYTYAGLTYAVHVFLNSGKFTVYKGNNNATHTLTCDILIQAGGGSGQFNGGGGGAGELAYKAAQAVTMGSKTVTVGAGGPRATGYVTTTAGDGADSVFDSFTANGGGGGGSHSVAPKAGFTGGSSGGHARDANNTTPTAVTKTASGLGNVGGVVGAPTWGASAGGGGAGGAGSNGSMSAGGNPDQSAPGSGGSGSYNWLASDGEQTKQLLFAAGIGHRNMGNHFIYMAGGGGGCTADSDMDDGGKGGTGGGGLGGRGNNDNIGGAFVHDGLPYTGGGGGSENSGHSRSGTGGKGVVIIRYAI